MLPAPGLDRPQGTHRPDPPLERSDASVPDAARPAVHGDKLADANEIGNGGPLDNNPAVCLVGFSKNLCNGNLTGGLWKRVQCTTPIACKTLIGTDAQLRVNMRNNPDLCDPNGVATCDEAPDVSGVFVAKLNFRVRLNGPCPVRGCWEGTWTLFGDGPVIFPIASGNIEGTLGVGTHRVPLCVTPVPGRCGDPCERCYNAQLDPNVEPPRWIIHVEGSMRGTVSQGQHAGCRVCVTVQGYFVAPADADGNLIPPNVTPTGWSFCGTADGVLECDCITP